MKFMYKDAILDQLAQRANVAQFVSFDPNLQQRYARVFGRDPNYSFGSIKEAIATLLEESVEHSVNVRSYNPESPKTRPFIYGVTDVEKACQHVKELAGQGLYTIVNETIDIHDGGVSGVALGDILEFAPDDTPRAVEAEGTAALPRAFGLDLLTTVYGFSPLLNYDASTRVEFSIHPLRRGVHREHTIIWELEDNQYTPANPDIYWPNRFSKFLGDKTYGLLIANLLGLPVPQTTCISRRIAPFYFGQSTGLDETWIRTAPTVQVPGKFTTRRGWTDPFRLMSSEDPSGDMIASILGQAGIDAEYSGGLVVTEDEEITIEGTRGFGEDFMTGMTQRMNIPKRVRSAVIELYQKASSELGPVRLEWVYDGKQAWVVQLHRGATVSRGLTIFPGETDSYREFKLEQGLEKLRELITELEGTGEGITLVGNVGITSHFGDILRKAQIPSFIKPGTEPTI